MPKIIPGLGPRILESAARHFETNGFEATDMKSLAKELGISVGTLYNYYPSKPELFLAVSGLWKERLRQRMLARLDHVDSPEAKLRAALMMLYEDMEAFTGFWKEFVRSGAKFAPASRLGKRFKEDNDELNHRLQELFRDVWKNYPNSGPLVNDPGDRLAHLMVGSIMQLVVNANDDRKSNREFFDKWINFIAPSAPIEETAPR